MQITIKLVRNAINNTNKKCNTTLKDKSRVNSTKNISGPKWAKGQLQQLPVLRNQ